MQPAPATYPVSVIITFRDHETSLSNCLESILNNALACEITLLNTGSTDSSPEIAKAYQERYPSIQYPEQPYRSIGAARNHGIRISQGEYIFFIEPADKIAAGPLEQLYRQAAQTRSDIAGGQPMDINTGRVMSGVPDILEDKTLSGPESFIALMRSHRYIPKSVGYLFRKDFLNRWNLRFDEECLNPDELWLQSAFCLAGTVCLTDIGCYYPGSGDPPIYNVDRQGPQYARDQLHIGDSIFELAGHFTSGPGDKVLRSWIYANGLRVYAAAFRIVTALRTHSVFDLPAHRMHTYREIQEEIVPEAIPLCERYYKQSAAFEHEYLVWRENPCDPIISGMTELQLQDKRIILVYNGPAWQDYTDTLSNLPPDYILTLDRKYQDQAYAIVFYMPGLNEHVYSDLEKPDGQVWIRWNMEPESKFPWMLNEELDEIFDLRMDYHAFADIVCPYYARFKADNVPQDIYPHARKNKICMLVSSGVNQSKREEYLGEFMRYTGVDSYGRLFRNAIMPGEDKGWRSKIDLYGKYKFVIAFENSVLEDYVTEKLYDPLLAGAVPIYLGAPNVEEYVPGEKCLINAGDFSSAKELADYINLCYADDREYMKYHQWRRQPWKEDFVRKVDIQDHSPFVRLCHVLDRYSYE